MLTFMKLYTNIFPTVNAQISLCKQVNSFEIIFAAHISSRVLDDGLSHIYGTFPHRNQSMHIQHAWLQKVVSVGVHKL